MTMAMRTGKAGAGRLGRGPLAALPTVVPLAVLLLVLAAPAFAQSCGNKAVGADGKPLSFSGTFVFLRKCITEDCKAKAVDKDGKPLTGAARAAFLKKCENA